MTRNRDLRIIPASDSALLVEYPSLEDTVAHFQALEAAHVPGVEELMPAAKTILVRFDNTLTDHDCLARAIRSIPPASGQIEGSQEALIDVIYDGEDLAEVADILGLSIPQLIERHTKATWKVAFIGYAPGFAYCVGDDPIFNVPRRSTPRTRIRAGSVGLAGTFSGIYPRESPGGWQMLGHTNEKMWDLSRPKPSLLQPGQVVRYRAVTETIEVNDPTQASEAEETRQENQTDAAASGNYFEVIRPGTQLLIEDLGRPGQLRLGVGAAGAADKRSLRGANRTVGNPQAAPALEIAGGGAQIKFNCDTVVAFTGASGPRSIVSADGQEFPLKRGLPVAVEPGDTVKIGAFHRGLRGYLAVRGSFDIEPQLLSCSTDTMSGIGPNPLQTGDRIKLGDYPVTASVEFDERLYPKLPTHDEVITLQITLGPRTDWFTSAALKTLEQQEWTVTPQSNRVGVRLHGPIPLEREITEELVSEGAVRGAIQVPADGQPVIFLADHPVTGGYPIIGAISSKDLDVTGQLAPGMKVKFQVTDNFRAL